METARYILLATFCLSLLYMAYRLLFRNETSFSILRIYLLGSVFLSLLLPLITCKIQTGFSFFDPPQQVNYLYTVATGPQPEAMQQKQDSGFWSALSNTLLNRQNLGTIMIYLYLVVLSFLLFRLTAQVTWLSMVYFRSKKVRQENYTLLFNHGFRHTFSFFRWIFVDNETASTREVEQIIAHETIHISQHHSFDIVLMELLTAMMWFNPLAWKMKKELQLVHEYLADDGVLNTGVDRHSYQALLINQVAGERLISLSSSFNYSLIKKRIAMMTTQKIKQHNKAKLLTLIPLSAALLVIIALTNGALAKEATPTLNAKNPPSDQFVKMALSLPLEAADDTIKKKTIVKMVHSNNPNDTVVEEIEEVVITKDSSGHKYVTVVESGSNIRRYETLPGAEKNFHKKTVIITSDDVREDQSTAETDVEVFFENKGTPKDTVYVSNVEKKFKTTNDKSGSEVKTIVISRSGNENPNILYIIDGVEQSGNDALLKINPDEIHSIEVIKDDHAKKYTQKEVDGVIIITTKKDRK